VQLAIAALLLCRWRHNPSWQRYRPHRCRICGPWSCLAALNTTWTKVAALQWKGPQTGAAERPGLAKYIGGKNSNMTLGRLYLMESRVPPAGAPEPQLLLPAAALEQAPGHSAEALLHTNEVCTHSRHMLCMSSERCRCRMPSSSTFRQSIPAAAALPWHRLAALLVRTCAALLLCMGCPAHRAQPSLARLYLSGV
jgi:hypothetical protein